MNPDITAKLRAPIPGQLIKQSQVTIDRDVLAVLVYGAAHVTPMLRAVEGDERFLSAETVKHAVNVARDAIKRHDAQ
jgi:hypothetical protein